MGERAQSMDATISESWSKDVSNLHLHVTGRLNLRRGQNLVHVHSFKKLKMKAQNKTPKWLTISDIYQTANF